MRQRIKGDESMSDKDSQQARATWREAMTARWKSFGAVIFDPWNLGLLLLAAVMLYFGQKNVGESANVIAQIVLALSTGVLGGRIPPATTPTQQ